jgi:hypothetical protein
MLILLGALLLIWGTLNAGLLRVCYYPGEAEVVLWSEGRWVALRVQNSPSGASTTPEDAYLRALARIGEPSKYESVDWWPGRVAFSFRVWTALSLGLVFVGGVILLMADRRQASGTG